MTVSVVSASSPSLFVVVGVYWRSSSSWICDYDYDLTILLLSVYMNSSLMVMQCWALNNNCAHGKFVSSVPQPQAVMEATATEPQISSW